MVIKKNTAQFQKELRIPEFLKEYEDESQCFKALVEMRWHAGFRCPRCESHSPCRLKHDIPFSRAMTATLRPP
ncbi:MAG: transposase [Alphaproteobacteria bacterium]|nr:transposase [Alphaproteobacteria bacterium]